MKKVFKMFILLLNILCLVSCVSEKTGRYGGTDTEGLTADAVVEKCYEFFEKDDIEKTGSFSLKGKLFDERTELISLNKCYIVENYKADEFDEWCQQVFAYCVVQTSSEIYCKEDCALGEKGDSITLNYAYYLIMENENSQWMIADFGYPPAELLV